MQGIVATLSLIPKKILAFSALVLIYLAINLVYKLSGATGKYAYSPSSALCLAEFFKMLMSLGMVSKSVETDDISWSWTWFKTKTRGVIATIRQHMTPQLVREIFGLATLYLVNNNMAFWIFLYADPASIQLIKSGTSFVSALIMWGMLKRKITELRWIAICLQICGLIAVQYDPCKSSMVLSFAVYLALLLAVFITSISSVWNERVVKSGPPLNVTNSVLYFFGMLLNFVWFHLFAESNKAFFDGYDWMGISVVICNAFIGLAVSAVYKYADVIVKLFSITCVTGILMIFNSFLFEWKPNVVIVAGTLVVFAGTYIYMKYDKPMIPKAELDAVKLTEVSVGKVEDDDEIGAAGEGKGGATIAVERRVKLDEYPMSGDVVKKEKGADE